MRRGFQAALALLMLVAAAACNHSPQERGGRVITDSAGRRVTIPDTVRSVIALKSGAMRLLSYMEVTGLVTHIEGSEQRRNVLYLFANPHLRELPVIGAGNNYDTELLAAAAPDLIIATYMPPREADRLQRLIRRPVVLVDYGDMGLRKEQLYGSLSLLGEIFHRERRADSLIAFMEEEVVELARRAAAATEELPEVYVGGVAYNGAHGITATEPDYPPFRWLSLGNVASGLSLRGNGGETSGEVVYIDPGQLVAWNPEVIFLDASGRRIWDKEITASPAYSPLRALRNGEVYTVLPYNWNSVNYENLFCNAWYIGTLLMPSAFGDVDPEERCREIFRTFYGKDIYDKAVEYYRPFERYGGESGESGDDQEMIP